MEAGLRLATIVWGCPAGGLLSKWWRYVFCFWRGAVVAAPQLSWSFKAAYKSRVQPCRSWLRDVLLEQWLDDNSMAVLAHISCRRTYRNYARYATTRIPRHSGTHYPFERHQAALKSLVVISANQTYALEWMLSFANIFCE